MAKPLFKIIVPAYNAAAYIDTCIQSLQSQTYSRWDAICIDDGSTDETPQILDRYASEDERIYVIHQENGGVGKARNAGLALVQPDKDTYISFVDADDFVSSAMYSTIADVIEDMECQGTIPDYFRLYCQHTRSREHNMAVPDAYVPDYKIVNGGGYFQNGVVGGFVHSCLINSTILGTNRFPEDIKVLEDQVFSIRCALQSQVFVLLKNRNYFYYLCPTSITHQNVSRVNDIVRCINYIQVSMRGVEDKAVQNYFNQHYFPAKIQMLLDYLLKFGGLESAPALLISPTAYLKGWQVRIKYLFAKITRKI